MRKKQIAPVRPATPKFYVRAFVPDEAYMADVAEATTSPWYLAHAESAALSDEAIGEVLENRLWSDVDAADAGETMAAHFEKNGYTVLDSAPYGIYVATMWD